MSVFWFMTPRSDVVGYHRFGGLCCSHLQVDVTSHHCTASQPTRPVPDIKMCMKNCVMCG